MEGPPRALGNLGRAREEAVHAWLRGNTGSGVPTVTAKISNGFNIIIEQEGVSTYLREPYYIDTVQQPSIPRASQILGSLA
jgi:hypothetical protein